MSADRTHPAWAGMDAAMRRVYAGFDAAQAAELGRCGMAPSCAAGCHHCCQVVVTVTLAEALALAMWVLRDDGDGREARVARFRALLPAMRRQADALAVPTMTALAWAHTRTPCPLLVPGGLCGVYAMRPLACRAYLSFDPPEACEPPGARVHSTDVRPVMRQATPTMQQWLASVGVPITCGPLQAMVPEGWALARLGPVAYMRRVRGSWRADTRASCEQWMHLERGDKRPGAAAARARLEGA